VRPDETEASAFTRADPWLWIAFLLPTFAVLLSLMQTEDLAYQVRAGSLMWASRSVLRTDPFTFTVGGSPWHDQQWGAQIILAGIQALGTWRALVVARAGIVGAVVGVTYLRTRARSETSLNGAILTFGPLVVCMSLPGSLAMRPQLLAVPLFVIAGVLLGRRRTHGQELWWLPAIGVVWANLHGSFVLLPVLCGIALAADLIDRASGIRRLIVVTVLVVVGGGLTPWGFSSYVYVYELARMPIVRDVIDEWKPIWQQGIAGALFAVALAGTVLVLARGWRRAQLEDLVTIAVFTAFAMASGRNVIWWFLAVPPALAPCLRRFGPAADWSRRATRLVALAASLAVVAGLVRVIETPADQLLADAPQGITDTVRSSVGSEGRVFSGWWGSWLEYAVPNATQFVDARVEIYPTDLWADYFRISAAAPGWKRSLDRWGVDVVVASSAHQGPLIKALQADPRWRSAYADGAGDVFVRTTG
jgi:hypothetical protein